MQSQPINRRQFVAATASTAAAALAASPAFTQVSDADDTLAALGGKPVRKEGFPGWPVIGDNDRAAWQKVLAEGRWCRLDGSHVTSFERAYAEATGTRHCVATTNGTSALYAAINALGVGPGDEVIVPPYTFVATINVVLLQHALPIFVDTDRETSQIDHRKIEAAITPRTTCIMPVHLGGGAANLDAILEVSQRKNVPVIEDTCQSHLGEWRGKKLGSFGKAGCFSFQASKNLNCGEGGAIIGDDEDFMDRCYAFQNNGRGRKRGGYAYGQGGSNLRLTEFQGELLLTQMARLEQQMRRREENARYLTQLIREIPGLTPAKEYDGATRNAYHLYMYRYDKEQFGGAPRSKFLAALRREGIPCSGGYTPLNREPFLKEVIGAKGYQRVFGPKVVAEWQERNHCPENDRLCEEAVWFTQTMLLGPRSDMDQIAAALRKIHRHAGELTKVG